MAKKLLIREPLTEDGTNLKYDEDNKVVYRESFVEDNKTVRRQYESLNSNRPEHMRFTVTSVETEIGVHPSGHEVEMIAKQSKKAAEASDDDDADDLIGDSKQGAKPGPKPKK